MHSLFDIAWRLCCRRPPLSRATANDAQENSARFVAERLKVGADDAPAVQTRRYATQSAAVIAISVFQKCLAFAFPLAIPVLCIWRVAIRVRSVLPVTSGKTVRVMREAPDRAEFGW